MEKRKKLISIEIENRLDGSIIISGEYASIKDALEKNRSADLSSAKADEPVYMVDLYLLKMQPATTKLRAWKYLRDGKSPYQNYEYEVGKTYRFKDIYCDERNLCGPGGNVATLMWCLKDSTDADEFIEVEFLARDVVMPLFSDGKWRVKRFKVLKKVNRKKAIKILNDALARKPR